MTINTMRVWGTAIVCAGSLGMAAIGFAGQGDPSAFGRTGNQGEGFSSEQKGSERLDKSTRGPRTPESSAGQDAQITMGGARPTLEGEVLKIQGESYTIRDQSGSEVRVRVDNNTNMDCAIGKGEGAAMSTGRGRDEQQEIPPTAHMEQQMGGQQGQASGKRQEQMGKEIVQEQSQSQSGERSQERTARMEQGQGGSQQRHERMGDQSGTQSRSAMGSESGGDIARGSGFTVGPKSGCQFREGDKVKAEVSDLGTVLLLKKISDREMSPSKSMGRGQEILPPQ